MSGASNERSPAGVSRRSLFKKTLGGAALLAAAGAVPIALRQTKLRDLPAGRALKFFTPAEYAIVAAIADRVLAEQLPPGVEPKDAPGGEPILPREITGQIATNPPAPSPAELDVAGRIDAFLAPSDPATARDFKQLLALFDNALFSLLGGGPPKPFTQMAPAQQDRHLARWAHSRLAIQRTGYQAVKRLCGAIYYAAPEGYAAAGYPGPPYELVREVNAARDAAANAATNSEPAGSPIGAAPANQAAPAANTKVNSHSGSLGSGGENANVTSHSGSPHGGAP